MSSSKTVVLLTAAEASLSLPLVDLAHGIASSPNWQQAINSVLIVKPHPKPTLAALGQFDLTNQTRLEFLSRWLGDVASTLRSVDYRQIEQSCEQLADNLQSALGSKMLEECCFTAIPRGGLIVLGILSYVLGIKQSQLVPPFSTTQPLVVIDDCALTGSRFYRFLLNDCSHPAIVFAPLYAHRDLCSAISTKESRVSACLCGQELKDYAPERWGAEYPEWRAQTAQRLTNERYWIGQTEQLCFPWNEPDSNFWNLVTNEMESGWRLFPPQHCLRNRFAADKTNISVQVQPQGKGRVRPADSVLFGRWQSQTVVSDLSTGNSFQLEGVAADFWHALVDSVSLEAAATVLLADYDIDADTLTSDFRRFTQDLLSKGVLTDAHA